MPDVRLIDGNALVKTIKSVHCKDCNNYNGVMCRACKWMDAMDYIEDAPSIYCSECGMDNETICPSDFCPNCGAKMDGGSDD